MAPKLVGPQVLLDANTGEGRIGRTGEEIKSDLQARFYEQAKRGNVFHGQTAVTGVAPGMAIGTTAAFALYNPVASGVDLVVLAATMQYLSGTLGIGFVSWVGHTNPAQAALTGTAIPVVNGRISASAGQGKPLTTATVPASGTPFRPFADLPPMLATSVLTPWVFSDIVDGAIVIPPGCGVSLQGTAAAGSTPLVVFGMSWMEQPI